MAKQNNAQTLKTTVMQKEFWVGLVTTLIVLLVAFKLIPWNNLQQIKTNKTVNETSMVPTGESIASSGAMTVANSTNNTATNSGAMGNPMAANRQPNAVISSGNKMKVSTLADTSGNIYTVENGDSYYKISLKVCGTGKYFESIQMQNEDASLYAGDIVTVNCTE